MKNSKLIRLLSTFEFEEWKRFEDFIKSPYFNKREDLILFAQYLNSILSNISESKISKQNTKKELGDLGLTLDDKKLNYLMNYLLELSEQFISLRRLEKDDFQKNKFLLSYYSEKNLQKHFEQKSKKATTKLESLTNNFSSYHLNQYLLSDLKAEEFAGRQIRVFNHHFQEVADKLDEFYFIKKIKLSLRMYNQQILFPGEYQMNFVEEIKEYLQTRSNNSPELEVYFQTYLMLSDEENEDYFKKAKRLLNKFIHDIPINELRDPYVHNINYCLRKIRGGNKDYVEEALNLYLTGIENGILLDNGFLSPWKYTNVIKLALRLKKYDWIKTFIEKYKEKINESFRENAVSYNLSELNYHTKNYDQALEELNKVKFSDMIYHMGSRVILIKIYYEKNEFESLLSLIASFSMFLKRNKKISKNLKTPYLNFCELLHQILRSPLKKKELIKSKIENEPILNDRTWLLEVLKKEMNEIKH